MKKNILLLINGFGIEQSDSVNVYNEKLMPNMDRLTKMLQVHEQSSALHTVYVCLLFPTCTWTYSKSIGRIQ